MSSSAIYRPPQWQTPSPARILLTFPGQPNTAQYSSATGINATLPNAQTNYVFDAVIVAAHGQELRPTEHPVQTGASTSDHAYIMPAQLALDIGMSDAMDAYFSPSTWAGASSKSVSCYQTLLALQFSRIPLTVTTRLRTYTNMLIRNLTDEETAKTIGGLRARVEFYQIFMANIVVIPNSARPQDTQITNLGAKTPQNPTRAQQAQNNVQNAAPSVYNEYTNIYDFAGGNWSSTNINKLQALPPGR